MLLRTVLIITFTGVSLLLGARAQAQVATSPLSQDQRIINPAAAMSRGSQGIAASFTHDVETSKASSLITSSKLAIDTKVDTLNFNGSWKKGRLVYELSLLPQLGQRDTQSAWVSGGLDQTNDTSRKLSLIPIQALVATKLGSWAAVGLKALFTQASVDIGDKVGYSDGSKTEVVETSGSQSVSFFSLTPGLTFEVYKTGFFLAYTADFMMEVLDENSRTQRSVTTTSYSGITSQEKNGKTTIRLRKDIFGLGYIKKFTGKDLLRVDLSLEQMPSLDPSVIPDGQLYRILTEATWSYFHAGVQVTSSSGYYIDPYNLVPYFFGTQDLSGKMILDYGFFGGLRSSKGHSFGISYSHSSGTKEERLSATSNSSIELDHEATTYGVSYSYLF